MRWRDMRGSDNLEDREGAGPPGRGLGGGVMLGGAGLIAVVAISLLLGLNPLDVLVSLQGGGAPSDLLEPGVGVASGPSAAGLAEACEWAMQLAALPETVEACRAAARRYDWDQAIAPRLEAIYRGIQAAA